MSQGTKRTGRPLKRAEVGKRASLGLKVTPQIKERLDRAAGESGRTQSQEAEVRLERSFNREDLLSEALILAYGRELAGLLMTLGTTMQRAGRHAGFMATYTTESANTWWNEPRAYDQAVQAAVRLLEAAAPAGDRTPLQEPTKTFSGIGFANSMIDAICHGKGTASLQAEADNVRPLLGPIVKRLKKSRR